MSSPQKRSLVAFFACLLLAVPSSAFVMVSGTSAPLAVRTVSTENAASEEETAATTAEESEVPSLEKMAADEAGVRFALGVNLASKFGEVRRLFSDDEIPAIVDGMGAYLMGSLEDADALLRQNAAAINEMLQERTVASIQAEKAVGAAFVAEAAKRPGAKTTASGLVFESVEEGAGPSPTAGSTVTCHYVGSLTDGTVFDSSRDRGDKPAQFALKQVIPGWQEALLMMSEGGTAKLTIPSNLAYGDTGSGDRIPGGATICFEVELVKVLTGGVGGLIIP